MKELHVIITGATGMVGEGVLHTCLQHPHVARVLVINRKPCGVTDPKLTEIIHADFFDLSSIKDRLTGYNACFFCLGVSSVGMKEVVYYRLTYVLTMHVAETLAAQNPGMTFCYVSGAGTDPAEKGRLMWARVKGKTETDLAKLPFRKTHMFRPALIKPMKRMKHTQPYYKYFGWLLPIFKSLAPQYVNTLDEIGLAMIYCALYHNEQQVLEVKDIARLAAMQPQ